MKLDSKTIAATIVFVALTLVLTLSPIKIPAPYATFLIYQIWEIPIVVAFLLYGPKVGVTVSVVNTLALLIIFTGQLPTGPLYNLAAILSMLLGMYVVYKASFVLSHKFAGSEYVTEVAVYITLTILSITGALVQTLWWLFPACVFGLLSITVIIEGLYKKSEYEPSAPLPPTKRQNALIVIASTVVGTFSRVLIMSIVNVTFLPFPPPVGFGLPQEAAIAILPIIGFFNATLALYTIPLGHIITRIVSLGVKTAAWHQRN